MTAVVAFSIGMRLCDGSALTHTTYVLQTGEGPADPLPKAAASEGGGGVVEQPEEGAVVLALGLGGKDLL